jgi:hypothetical protein
MPSEDRDERFELTRAYTASPPGATMTGEPRVPPDHHDADGREHLWDGREEISPPARFDAILKAVCAKDRAYFDRYPAAPFYVRQYVPGELWPIHHPQNTWMVVTNLRPGMRMRTPIIGGTAEGAERWARARLAGMGPALPPTGTAS